ncbi:hypothetical protein [Roseomonas elaeocarpi]|uniref:Tat pathway signal protein n=1 Tax=Roseomonas elaeocarpi TaxID=907779 RepID=A0ABV6JRL7_9PROT
MITGHRRLFFAAALLTATAAPALAAGPQGNDPTFFLVNNSGDTINEAYVSSSRQDNWGEDRLGENVLSSGLALRIAPPRGQCNNDIRVVYDGGRSEERRNVNTCNGFEVVFGPGNSGSGRSANGAGTGSGQTGNPSFNLVNNTRQKITVVRASPNSAQDWGDDRLNSRAGIEPGKTAAIRLPEGPCDYDVRVEYQGGRVEERRNIDLCNAVNVSFP